MPAYKNKVWEKISAMHSQYEEEKGYQGLRAGEDARRRLVDKQKINESKESNNLEDLILQTSKTSALQAINLS